jgi:hypothetical protein
MIEEVFGKKVALRENRHQITEAGGRSDRAPEGRRLPLAKAHKILQRAFRRGRADQQTFKLLAGAGEKMAAQIRDFTLRPRPVLIVEIEQTLHLSNGLV